MSEPYGVSEPECKPLQPGPNCDCRQCQFRKHCSDMLRVSAYSGNSRVWIMPTNKTRADRAEAALETYRGVDIVDESHIQDIISDILHLAVRRKLDPVFFGRAVRNFEAEVKDKKWRSWSSRAGAVLRSLEEGVGGRIT